MVDYDFILENEIALRQNKETRIPSYSNDYSNEHEGFVWSYSIFIGVLYPSQFYLSVQIICVWDCEM